MNKKLLKSIACVVSGVAIATSIPFTVSSCGSSVTGDVEINYDGSEESKTLQKISYDYQDRPNTTSSSGTFYVLPKKPTSFHWSFTVYHKEYQDNWVLYPNWVDYIKIEINNDNKLQVTAIARNSQDYKIEVSGKYNDEKTTNSITFNIKVFC